MTFEITEAIGTELLFEDDRILVWSMTLDPGESSPVHRHTRDWLYVYVTDDNRMETRFHNGRREPGHFADGYTAFHALGDGKHPDLVHALHNAGDHTHRQVLIEFKGESQSSSPEPQRTDNGRRE